MAKIDIVRRLSLVLSRGWGDPSVFAGKKQDDLINQFAGFLDKHRKLIGASMQLEQSHALNEKGVDLMLRLDDFRAGYQLKVESDVLAKNFAENVKRQILDSQAHKLDKMNVLICAPYTIDGKDMSMKINSLINDLSVAGTGYHAVYPPPNAAKLFDGTAPLTEQEFRLEEQRFLYEPTTAEQLARALQLIEQAQSATSAPRRTKSAGDFIEDDRRVGKPATSLAKMNAAVGWNHSAEELKPVLEEINELLGVLERVPAVQRGFLLTCLRRAEQCRGFGNQRYSDVSVHEIEGALRMGVEDIKPNVIVLERFRLASFDLDEPDNPKISIRAGRADWNIFEEMKRFCKATGEDLKRIIVDLDFRVFD